MIFSSVVTAVFDACCRRRLACPEGGASGLPPGGIEFRLPDPPIERLRSDFGLLSGFFDASLRQQCGNRLIHLSAEFRAVARYRRTLALTASPSSYFHLHGLRRTFQIRQTRLDRFHLICRLRMPENHFDSFQTRRHRRAGIVHNPQQYRDRRARCLLQPRDGLSEHRAQSLPPDGLELRFLHPSAQRLRTDFSGECGCGDRRLCQQRGNRLVLFTAELRSVAYHRPPPAIFPPPFRQAQSRNSGYGRIPEKASVVIARKKIFISLCQYALVGRPVHFR